MLMSMRIVHGERRSVLVSAKSGAEKLARTATDASQFDSDSDHDRAEVSLSIRLPKVNLTLPLFTMASLTLHSTLAYSHSDSWSPCIYSRDGIRGR
jgi:hypothetical protein